METLTLDDIRKMCGVGRELAERYARQSGALLPRPNRGKYIVVRKTFEEWLKGGAR